MRVDNELVLVLGPLRLLYCRVEVVVPALPALLPKSALELLRDEAPFLLSVFTYKVLDELVLFFGGWLEFCRGEGDCGWAVSAAAL